MFDVVFQLSISTFGLHRDGDGGARRVCEEKNGEARQARLYGAKIAAKGHRHVPCVVQNNAEQSRTEHKAKQNKAEQSKQSRRMQRKRKKEERRRKKKRNQITYGERLDEPRDEPLSGQSRALMKKKMK